jgi:tetratricopeptide (TPR) repeat protein
VDLEAYNLYLRGRYFWNKRTGEGLRKSIEYYSRAIGKCPDYALAYAGLADSYTSLPVWTTLPTREFCPKATEAALRALEIDDTLAEAHTSLAFLKASFDYDWEDSEKEFKRAIELNPGYAMAHTWYTICLRAGPALARDK